MSGTRSRENAANRQAVTNYNGTGNHRVSNKSVAQERRYSATYGNPVGGATGEGQRKRKKMKGLWLLIFLILALGSYLTYLLLEGDKSSPQVANEVTVDSTEVSSQKRLEQVKRIQEQEAKQRSQEAKPEPVNEEPAKKVEYAPNGEILLEMPEFPEDGNFTPEWLERKKKWDEQQLRIMEWREQHGSNSVYIEYKEPSFDEFLVSNYRLSRRYSRTAEYM